MTDKTARKATLRKRGAEYIYNVGAIPQLSDAEKARLQEVARRYPFFANSYYLGLIDWDNPDDPIRRIIIPNEGELTDWGRLDPSDEKSNTVAMGVQHKYASTVLLLVNENCAGFCRYCFRKRIFQPGNREASYDISPGLDYIQKHEEVDNVLITGGDPLMLPTVRLEQFVAALGQIKHVKIIRIGSKMTAYNPYRILNDPKLLGMFEKYSLPDRRIYMMCHFDHPNELTAQSREAIYRLQRAGAICVNQNPIIRGISDDPAVMSRLWNELSYIGVPQYYIFQGRPTLGNEPYAVPIVDAYFRIEEAKKKCSGLAKRIRYVMSHESGKIEIAGVDEKFIYLKYHRAKHVRNENRFFICHRNDSALWLDQLRPADGFRNRYYQSELTRSLRLNPGLREYGEEGHA